MARYRRPPDPRKPQADLEPLHYESPRDDRREPIPWLWLGLGVLFTLVGLALSAAFIGIMLSREPLSSALPTPTIIRLTAPPTSRPSPTSLRPTTTAIPTFTPPPTPDLSIAPEAITVGYYAQVANTENIGVSLRGGPSTDNIRLTLIPELTLLLVVGGPQEGSGFVWWQVRLDDGTEGWVAGDFLVPAASDE